MSIESILLKIRRRDTPSYAALHHFAKAFARLELPVIPPLHGLLYHERRARLTIWGHMRRTLYWEPLFKARCERVGRHLRLDGGLPLVMGHLRLRIGTGVRISGTTTFAAARRASDPLLEIGDHSYIGYQVTISVGHRVSLGHHVLIANRVFLVGDDGHPIDPIARRTEPADGTGSIVIGDDAWIGESAIILKNVRIGRGAIVAAGAVVTSDVPDLAVIAGNPARIVRHLDPSLLTPRERHTTPGIQG